jgi:prophage maintenance system killer protein
MISFEELVGINIAVCQSAGEVSVVINKDNLLSALSVQQWYEDDRLLASALIRSITIGHGFQDGNKRTAAIVGAVIQDYDCSEDAMISCILDIAKGQLKDVEKIASILYDFAG